MKTHVNLLPQSFRRRQLIGLRLKQWSVVWTLVAALTLAMGWSDWSRYQTARHRLVTIETEYAPLETIGNEISDIRARIRDLEQRESLALELAEDESALAVIGLVSRATRDCDGTICVRSLVLERRSRPSSLSGNVARDDETTLTLQGVGVDDLSVARFVAALRDMDVFDHVGLQSSGPTTIGTKKGRKYSVESAF